MFDDDYNEYNDFGQDDLENMNANEADDYRNEGSEEDYCDYEWDDDDDDMDDGDDDPDADYSYDDDYDEGGE